MQIMDLSIGYRGVRVEIENRATIEPSRARATPY